MSLARRPEPGPARRVAVVGVGSAGSRYLRCLSALGFADLVGVTRKEGAARSALPEGPVYVPDLERAIDLGVDAAVVASPTSLHVTHARALVEAGAHVLVEKPLSDRMEGVAELGEAARRAGVRCATVFQMRHHPCVTAVRDLVAAGAIGRPYHAQLSVGQHLAQWHPWEDYRRGVSARVETGGGVLLDLIHEIDLARNLFGPFDEIAAHHARVSELDIETEDVAEIHLRRDGFLAHVHLDCFQHAPVRTLRVNGSEGTLAADLWNGSLWRAGPEGRPEAVAVEVPGRDGLFRAQLADFFAHLDDAEWGRREWDASVASLTLALAARATDFRWVRPG